MPRSKSGALLTAFVIWAMFGRRSNVGFFWFYLFGMKLLTIAGILMVRGLAWYVDRFDNRDTLR